MKRYLLMTVTMTLGLCLAVAFFNFRVDPYALYHPDRTDSDWLSRIDQFYHLRITKPWQLLQKKPAAIVVGTSRSATIAPRHPDWGGKRGYNLSIPGMTMYEMQRFIEYAQAVQPISKLMIGLDFETFVRPGTRSKQGFEEARMAHNAEEIRSPGFAWQLLGDARDTLLSLPGFTRSLSAFAGTAAVGRRYLADGTWESTTSTLTGRGGFVYIGKTSIFEAREEDLSIDENLDIYADILRFAHRQSIDTRLFVTPEHIFMIDLWWRIGYSDLWMEFHRQLVAVNDAVALELGVEPFPVFGFNQTQGIIDEPIRTSRNSAKSLFTDGVHFRPDLGESIMYSVWGGAGEIGVKLDANSVGAYLAEVEQVRQNFVSTDTELLASLRRGVSPSLE